jgi:hypothetical protein
MLPLRRQGRPENVISLMFNVLWNFKHQMVNKISRLVCSCQGDHDVALESAKEGRRAKPLLRNEEMRASDSLGVLKTDLIMQGSLCVHTGGGKGKYCCPIVRDFFVIFF